LSTFLPLAPIFDFDTDTDTDADTDFDEYQALVWGDASLGVIFCHALVNIFCHVKGLSPSQPVGFVARAGVADRQPGELSLPKRPG